MSPNSRLVAAVALTGLLAACSDGSAPTARSQVRFNLSTGAVTGPAFLSDTIATSTDTLVLDSVQLVLRDIKFQRVNEDACDNEDEPGDDATTDTVAHTVRMASSLHDDGGENDGDDGHADACESFNAGPYLLNVPLDTAVVKAFTIAVDTGTFDQVRFRIHKPEDDGDAKDVAFLAAHPDFNRVSIRVVGSFNGTPFTFITDLKAQERMALVPPLVVADSMQTVDVTIKIDLSHWFSNDAGGLVDPASALQGQPNEDLVKDNIRNSFRAFRDDNRDGEDDDHEGHD
jgi:hypothetical protein